MPLRSLLLALAALPLAANVFQPPIAIPLSRQGMNPVALATADINRDGVPDLIAANTGIPAGAFVPASSVSVLLGSRTALPSTLFEYAIEGNAADIAVADFAGDSAADVAILLATAGGGRVCLYTNTAGGAFLPPVCSAVPGNPSKLAVADWNGDNRPDLLVLRATDSAITLLLNTGASVFGVGATTPIVTPVAVVVADWNRDGVPDAAILSRTGSISVLLSFGNLPFQRTESLAISPNAQDLVAVDLNRDGMPDLVATDPQAAALGYAFARPEGLPVFQTLIGVPFPARAFTLRPADASGDGRPEIFAATPTGLLVIGVTAEGVLVPPSPPGVPPAGTGLFLPVDLNADGRRDVVVVAPAPPGASAYLLIAAGAPTYTTMTVSSNVAVFGQKTLLQARVRVDGVNVSAIPLSGAAIEFVSGQTVLATLAIPPPVLGSAEIANVQAEIALPAGTNRVRARFTGSPAYAASQSEEATVVVNPADSFLSFQSPPAPVSYTQGLRLNALVTGALSVPNEGIVRLSVNGSVISQAFVTAGLSQLFIPPSLPLGRVRVQLDYAGPNYLPSISEQREFVVTGGTAVAASAASYDPVTAAGGFAVVALRGLVRTAGQSAAALPWPAELNGLAVSLRPTGGAPVAAGISYAGTGQINIQVPESLPPGPAGILVSVDGVEAAAGTVQVARVAPGIFTVDGSGEGAPAALAARYPTGGEAVPVPVFNCALRPCQPEPMPVSGPEGEVILSLYGTGWRNAQAVSAFVDGVPMEVLFSGPQPETPGLDQLNLRIPAAVAGRGPVQLRVVADGISSNLVRVWIR